MKILFFLNFFFWNFQTKGSPYGFSKKCGSIKDRVPTKDLFCIDNWWSRHHKCLHFTLDGDPVSTAAIWSLQCHDHIGMACAHCRALFVAILDRHNSQFDGPMETNGNRLVYGVRWNSGLEWHRQLSIGRKYDHKTSLQQKDGFCSD